MIGVARLLTRWPERWRPSKLQSSGMINLTALAAALFFLSLSSIIIAQLSGAAVVGWYALLRILPWLVAVIVTSGLPIASAYFLASEHRDDPRLRPTLLMLAAAGSVLGVVAWLLAVPVMQDLLFAGVPAGLLVAMSGSVVAHLVVEWTRACCQGSGRMTGTNTLIVAEELFFLAAYGIALGAGLGGIEAVVAGLLGGGGAAVLVAGAWLARIGLLRIRARPSLRLARKVLSFGARGQLGNLMWLVNLRLDFVLLGALAGPAVLGVYAIASKFAELMRLPPTAMNYVLYPRFAASGRVIASGELPRLLRRATALTAICVPALALLSPVIIPLLYGDEFLDAIVPACIVLAGLAVEGAAAVSTAFLFGIGHPGANSFGMGVGVVVTAALDVVLIPQFGVVGAAIASAVAYVVTTSFLTTLAWRRAAPSKFTATEAESTRSTGSASTTLPQLREEK